MRSLLVLLSC